MPFDPSILTTSLNEAVARVIAWVPNLLGAILWILLGWIVARILRFILVRLLYRLNLDTLAERAGITRLLEDMGVDKSASRQLGRAVYWLILLVFVLAAVESLGLSQVATALDGLVSYLPNVLAAALILLFGSLIARLIGDGIGSLTRQTGVEAGPVLGQGVRYVLLVLVVILALEQLGLEAALLIFVAVALIGATLLTLTLAIGIGSRELARNIMAGFHAKDVFAVGQTLRVREHTGQLLSIGSVKAVIETAEGRVSLPNHLLTEEEVVMLQDDPA